MRLITALESNTLDLTRFNPVTMFLREMDYFTPHDPAEDAVDDSTREELFADDDGESPYHEAASKFLSMIVSTLVWIRQARTSQETMMRIDLARKFFGDVTMHGVSCAKIGKAHNRTRAAASNALLNLESALDMPPGFGQKLIIDRKTFSKSRNNNCTK